MTSYALDVGGKSYFPDIPVGTTKAAIVAAVRSGGDFVALSSAEVNVSVLVSPGLCVIVREVELAEDSVVGVPGIGGYYDEVDEWGL